MNSRVRLDPGAFETDVLRARLAAYGDKNLFGIDLLLLAVDRDSNCDSRFCFFYFVDSRAGVEIDAALAEDAGEFFRNFFVFDRHETRKHFDDRHFAVEGAVYRGELYADGTGADDD